MLIHHKRAPEEQAALNRLLIEMLEAEHEEVSAMAITSARVLTATNLTQSGL